MNNPHRIVILSGNHLCHNPRVVKEATTLASAGFAVEVLGGSHSSALAARDAELAQKLPFKFTIAVDNTRKTPSNFFSKVRRRCGSLTHRLFGLESHVQFEPARGAITRKAMQRDADLYIAHSEPALLTALDLLKAGKRVAVDMEDWFSEDMLPEARRLRPVRLLREAERKVLNSACVSFCPSIAMSDALAEAYAAPKPVVIYNSFPWHDRNAMDGLRKDRGENPAISIHWFSQTVGRGRGLEDLFKALPLIDFPFQVHLRGTPVQGFELWLKNQLPDVEIRKLVTVHPLVGNAELLSRISEHDIGFAGEMTYSRSRDLTITNKILQYLLGGLSVVASDTAGQREIAERADGAVELYRSGDHVALASVLNRLLGSAEHLANSKSAALRSAETTFCWERVSKHLLAAISQGICRQ